MKNLFLKLQPFLLTGSLIYGGLSGQNFTFITAVLIWFTLTFFILALTKKIIRYPPGFYLYMLFLIFFALNLFWTKNFWSTFWYLLIFSAGFFFWVIAYNLKKEFKHFDKLILMIGIIFGVLATYNYVTNPLLMDSFSLHKMSTKDHHHIADLWAVIFPVIIINLSTNTRKKIIWLLLLLSGFYLMYISESRTSIVSLLVGLFYLFYNSAELKKYKSVFYSFIFLGLFLFLFFARSKPTLPNRGYYLQGISGIIHHPLGIGVGNFGEFSSDPDNHIFGYSDYSSVGMNIFIEIFAGMGVFGIIFLVWFIKIFKSVFKKSNNTDVIYKIVFLVLTTNFMFDFTYLIPTMLWLWFISLGLSQSDA
ncbi:hypothetical protein A2767_04590 [Candidatus Roizmanbacteria bacterium RIFCSPHIGHO2_01_FULL_35_10]|uniref:O-antigen polymerase n=1 Tax=Candidatus Roizmanbacteria bacterium RIFCSPLOWO2_01_FULL_35_13 TaxID=1802055 RepID=A0A1F7I762_9BACT|nr:MAG: hypothetical protein A2767_04590 [Candidatus Roizmanbacteria bacterium RIFCSPHIGHO2_01_FULL_35_10]OGK39173.1 MAG: hypothetical protein A3A74_03700 [Candidatus Roizmanbacteria bacterium RIFCSPLOWO2_01_FULL_35_13]